MNRAALGDDADRNQRTLLQVKIDAGGDADEIFSRLMGDIVEPRREDHPGQRLDRQRRRVRSVLSPV
jgi:DNA gyrase/topoisomerase IV subunit B